ncbi:MAG: NUDIX hydrolase [Dehalococcoidia bacterium]|nr:NUDIX hydrolase [Dehalococcoidia bacterium]
MLPHDDMLAFGPDKIVIGKWAREIRGSRRVHYPRARMRRAGFALVVNERREVLLVREDGRQRRGKWSLPGGSIQRGEKRSDAARRETRKAGDVAIAVQSVYYENRHRARIYLAESVGDRVIGSGAKWFPLSGLPSDENLAFAVDVRTIKKWASENGIDRP